MIEPVHVKSTEKEGEKMIEKGLILIGSDAELLNRALSEVKTKIYEESEAQLDDAQALDALFRASEMPRMTVRKKTDITNILTPYVSAWCSARSFI
jgi:uncharacterized protein with PIN domain